jgi:heat-inducible transcriptional repressor
MIQELNKRSREIFREIVEAYVETGEPVGSRAISKKLDGRLSPASIRNVMADLEDAGLLFAPHTSAGRLPTQAGLRLFVDGLLELGDLSPDERSNIEARCAAQGRGVQDVLLEATSMLSGLSHCAGLVVAPKHEAPLRQVEFVDLGPGRALVVLVDENGLVENRVIELPLNLPRSALIQAGNYLSDRLRGRSMSVARTESGLELAQRRAELDELTSKVVQAGLAVWTAGEGRGTLIVRGQAKLLEDVNAVGDLERIRQLMEELEQQEELLNIIDMTQDGQGVQIFIGSENKLFPASGCTTIVAPFQNARQQVIGAIGVIGPTRLNYARIIPMVDFTARVVGRLLG